MAGGRIRPPACSTSPSISECDRRAARLPLTPSGGSLSVTAAAAGSFHIFLVFLPLSVAVIDFDYLWAPLYGQPQHAVPGRGLELCIQIFQLWPYIDLIQEG